MSLTTFRDAIQAWAAAAMGITVIWEDQPGDRPAYPYGTLKDLSDVGLGEDEITFEHDNTAAAGEDMIPTAIGHRAVTISMQVINKSSTQDQSLAHNVTAKHYLSLARENLRLPTPLETLRAANIAHNRTYAINDLSGTVDGEYESRASMDIQFGTTAVTTSATGISYINETEISGDFTGTSDPGALDFTDESFGG